MDTVTAEALALFKAAAGPPQLKGKLYLSSSGFLLLSVPNAIGRGAFDALNEAGIELPLSETSGQYNAHVTVMRPEEIKSLGGPGKITERGHEFGYSLGKIKDFNPIGWTEMNRCWVLEVRSPDLEKLRKSYGLTPLPVHPKNNEAMQFHITFAVRRSGVLGENDTAKNSETGRATSEKATDWDKPGVQALKVAVDDLTLAQTVAHAARRAVEPKSEEQASAGNYRKGHVSMHGLQVTIENKKGSTRSGTSKDGKKWAVELQNHYGYIRRSQDLDGDHVDVFIGPDPECELVYVVDQIDPATKSFDEHKCMLGFKKLKDAKEAYLANYEPGWKGLGKITPVTMQQFKEWLKDGSQFRPISTQTFKMRKKASDDSDEDVGSKSEDSPGILILQRSTTIRMIPPDQPRDEDGKFEEKDDLVRRMEDEFERLLENFNYPKDGFGSDEEYSK